MNSEQTDAFNRMRAERDTLRDQTAGFLRKIQELNEAARHADSDRHYGGRIIATVQELCETPAGTVLVDRRGTAAQVGRHGYRTVLWQAGNPTPVTPGSYGNLLPMRVVDSRPHTPAATE